MHQAVEFRPWKGPGASTSQTVQAGCSISILGPAGAVPAPNPYPFLEHLHRELGSPGLVVIGVNLDEKPKGA